MTYYEWINYFDSIKNSPISDDIINKINNSNLDYKGNIKVRYLNHIVKLINYRLNKELDNFLNKLKTISQDKDSLTIEINSLKKEINFCIKLASIKYFDQDVKDQLIKNIKSFAQEMNELIKNSFDNSNSSEILMIINNLDLSN